MISGLLWCAVVVFFSLVFSVLHWSLHLGATLPGSEPRGGLISFGLGLQSWWGDYFLIVVKLCGWERDEQSDQPCSYCTVVYNGYAGAS